MASEFLQKWDAVLVDWTNCMSLTPQPIQSIDELLDGEFFKSLIELLQPDLQTTLGEFLQVLYPNIPVGALQHAADARIAGTLLLHAMCTQNLREELIQRVCRLAPGVQLPIRHCLMHFSGSMHVNDLFGVLRDATEVTTQQPPIISNTPTTPRHVVEWNPAGESPASPLMEYFKTPAATRRRTVAEKDREIRRLQAELNTADFEKDDLGAELREQKARIAALTGDVQAKSAVIAELNAQLQELQDSDADKSAEPQKFKEVERILRAELVESQKYITELQAEHGELLCRGEQIALKLAQAEEATTIWQVRAVKAETKHDDLIRQHKAQEEELLALRTNYSELSALLDELRHSGLNASGSEMDTSTVGTQVADLGTVVEVQLLEAKEEIVVLQSRVSQTDSLDRRLQETLDTLEICQTTCKTLEELNQKHTAQLDEFSATNCDLLSKITDADNVRKSLEDALATNLEKSQRLDDELAETREQLASVNSAREALYGRNVELTTQIELLHSVQEDLQRVNEEIVRRVEDVTCENGMKDEQLEMLRRQMAENERALALNEDQVARLAEELTAVEKTNSELAARLQDRDSNYERLAGESRQLQQRYESAVEHYISSDFQLDAAQKQFSELDKAIQGNLDCLEELVNGSIASRDLAAVERLVQLIDGVAGKQSTFANKISQMEEINRQLDKQVEALRLSEVNNAERMNKLQEVLQKSEATVEEFSTDIKLQKEQIDQFKATISELEATVAQLEKGRIDFELRETQLVEELQISKSEFLIKTQDNEKLTYNVTTLEGTKKWLVDVIARLEDDIKTLRNNSFALENQMAEMELEQKKIISVNEEDIRRLTNAKEAAEKQLENVCAECALLKLDADGYIAKMKEFDRVVAQQNQENITLTASLRAVNAEREVLERQLEDQRASCESQRRAIEQLEEQSKKAENDILAITNENGEYVAEINELKRVQCELSQKIDQLNKVRKKDESHRKELQGKLNRAQTECRELRDELQRSQKLAEDRKARGDELSGKLEDAWIENSKCVEEKEALSLQFMDLQNKSEKLIVELENVSEELTETRTLNSNDKQTIDELMSELDTQLKKLTDKNSELAYLKEVYLTKDLEQLNRINDLNTQIDAHLETKEAMGAELRMLRDEVDGKCALLEETHATQRRTEEDYERSLLQQTKKIDLMHLTIANLERKIDGLHATQVDVETQFAAEVARVEELRADGETLREELDAVRAECEQLTTQLLAKDAECKHYDDIVDETTRELLAVRLSEEKSRKVLAELTEHNVHLQEELRAAEARVEELAAEYARLQEKAKLDTEELLAVTRMRDAIAAKQDQLRDSIFGVLTHYGVRRKTIKQSIDELKYYKDQKEEELCTVDTELAEARALIATLQEQNESVIVEYDRQIALKHTELQELEQHIDALKISEAEHLQEIANLKEELSYTVTLYTDAIKAQTEMKNENETRISRLSTQLDEMGARCEELTKENTTLTNELDYNMTALRELRVEQESLEMDIVRVKREYETDAANAAAEQQAERARLRKIETELLAEIGELRAALAGADSDVARLQQELTDCNEQLAVVRTEKCELARKMDAGEQACDALQRDYDAMKITNEQYMRETRTSLLATQEQLAADLKAREKTIAHKEKEIDRLRKENARTSEKLIAGERTHKHERLELEKKIRNLEESAAAFTRNLEQLSMEQACTKEKLNAAQTQLKTALVDKENDSKTIGDLEQKCANLTLSIEVLDAGAHKMEALLEDIRTHLSEAQNALADERAQHAASKERMQVQIDTVGAQLAQSETLVREKREEVATTNAALTSVQSILKSMTAKMEATSRQLAVIHEDYEGKLHAERRAFEELRAQHASVARETDYVRGLNDDLRRELESARAELAGAEASVAEKEALIGELQQRYAQCALVVRDKDAAIASLQAELAGQLGQLADAAGARRRAEAECGRVAEQIAAVMRERAHTVATHADGEAAMVRVQREIAALVARVADAEREQTARVADQDRLLAAERDAKRVLEVRVAQLAASVHDACEVRDKLAASAKRFGALLRDNADAMIGEDDVHEMMTALERRIVDVFAKMREMDDVRERAECERDSALKTLDDLTKCNQALVDEKEKLLASYDKLHLEKIALVQDKANESKSLVDLQLQYEELKGKELMSANVAEKLEHLQRTNEQRYACYLRFMQETQSVFKEIEALVRARNDIDQIVTGLKDIYMSMQLKSYRITEASNRLLFEQKTALEVIVEDIGKQYRRYSKMIYNLNLRCHAVLERTLEAIMHDKHVDWTGLYSETMDRAEIAERLDDLRENATNVLVQLETFVATIEEAGASGSKTVLKENILPPTPALGNKEEEWKRKYLVCKQKLTLMENSKNNFERKLRQMRTATAAPSLPPPPPIPPPRARELSLVDAGTISIVPTEDKKVDASTCTPSAPVDTNAEALCKQLQEQYAGLLVAVEKERANWRAETAVLEEQLSVVRSHPSSVQQQKEIEHLQEEMITVRKHYNDLHSAHCKLELEYAALENKVVVRDERIHDLQAIAERHTQLCEETTKLRAEIDTLRFKRQKDRDEYVRHINRDRASFEAKLKQDKEDTERLLEKIKDRTRDAAQTEVEYRSTIDSLKEQLKREQSKAEVLYAEKRHAEQQLKVAQMPAQPRASAFEFKEPMQRRASVQSLQGNSVRTINEERHNTMSLPRNLVGVVEEEVCLRRRTSFSVAPELQMEDEAEMFNNKYLHDLKTGKQSTTADDNDRESTSSRLSQFAYRNSLCPPHLKSSYPAETQFLDERQIREDDIKTGNIEYDDNPRAQLLPAEGKPGKNKKESGTTSYKRPGPPTPSKHGSRPSLQGNERAALRELAPEPQVQPKKTTPNRLRALFSSGSSSSHQSNASSNRRGENAVAPWATSTAENGSGRAASTSSSSSSPRKRSSLNFFRR